MCGELPSRDPCGSAARHLLLEIDVARDAVRVALQRERAVAEVREERRCDLLVVGEEVALRDAVVREENAVGAREMDGSDAGRLRESEVRL